jgi:protein tyrosine phosphatase (PTP) superfamily phosphohydrolase (DUF442 family)
MIKQTKPPLTRPYVRMVQGGYRSFRNTVSVRSPEWLRQRLDSTFDYFDLFMVDHGVFRALYSNTHPLSQDVWRSSQPAPRNIRRLAKRRGLKTIINLRGDRDCGSYRLEQQVCAKYGIKLINFSVKSRQAPERRVFHEAKALFDSIEYPVLLHCKSGADRAGLMSALFLILKAGVPVAEAKRQLSLRFGHIRQADTGVLDFVFDSYLAHSSREPIAFLDWVDQHYDENALGQQFKADCLANVVVNKLISRE